MRTARTTLGPVQVPDGVLVLRTPRVSDAVTWSGARTANREWLEPAFPAWGDDWPAEQSPAAWVQRCRRLQQARRRGVALPFVILLDGRLIGELGVEALDPLSGAGEASAWMTRSHGSSGVMHAASLLLIREAFTGPNPVDALLSPVATTSRRGRSPGLTAAGFRIEGTVARKVGAQGLVDHDLWVVRNTPAAVAHTEALLASFPGSLPAAEARTRVPPSALARVAVREARAAVTAVRSRRSRSPHDAVTPVQVDGTRRAAVHVVADHGTGVADVTVSVDPGAADDARLRPAVADALAVTLTEVAAGRYGTVRHAAVRVPLGAPVPDEQLLTGLGLRLVATLAGNPEGTRQWPGEQRWEPDRR